MNYLFKELFLYFCRNLLPCSCELLTLYQTFFRLFAAVHAYTALFFSYNRKYACYACQWQMALQREVRMQRCHLGHIVNKIASLYDTQQQHWKGHSLGIWVCVCCVTARGR